MSTQSIKTLLLIEDSAGDARLLREMLVAPDACLADLTHVECMRDAEKHLSEHSVDLILLDLGLPDAQGLEAIRRAREAAPRIPLVVLTGMDDEPMAALALQKGAQDYLIKDQLNAYSGTGGLLRVLRYAIERKRLELLKDEFVSSVSHELRTPLTSIAGSLGLLMGRATGTLPEPVVRLLSIAYENSQRLVRLVNDILDIEKMESGRVVFKFGRVQVRPLIEQAIESNRGFAQGFDVRIRLEDKCVVGEVRSDPDRLAQVITNLLSNAIKFSPPGAEVVVLIEKVAGTIRISVRDNGPGIPTDFQPRIFERFAQADGSHSGQKGGTGLGLSIVKQIVDRLDGTVGFAEAPGGGTIFHIQLPCWDNIAAAAIDHEASPGAMRILLCDDDPDSGTILRDQLRQVGFATDFALTASDAIMLATANQYCTILVDLQLPDSDGVSLILHLRTLPQYRDTPIIVVSAEPGHGRSDVRSSELNVLDWLNKPLDLDRLLGMLTKPARRASDRTVTKDDRPQRTGSA